MGSIKLDLFIKFSEYTGKQSKNQVVGSMYELNVKQGTDVTLEFTLKDVDGDKVSPDTTLFSVLDVDKEPSANQIVTAQGFNETKFGSKVTKEQSGSDYVFTSTRVGTPSDNPTDPMVLPDLAESSTVSLKYAGLNSWTVKLAVSGSAESGRNFFLGGATELMPPICS